MTGEALLAAGIAALFGLLVWLVKAMWALLKKLVTESLANITAVLNRLVEQNLVMTQRLEDLTGAVEEVTDDVEEISGAILVEDQTPVESPRGERQRIRVLGEYRVNKKKHS